VIFLGGCGGAHVAERRSNEVVNSYVPCIGIHADWYRPCNTNQQTTG